jgi:hypothetical protein
MSYKQAAHEMEQMISKLEIYEEIKTMFSFDTLINKFEESFDTYGRLIEYFDEKLKWQYKEVEIDYYCFDEEIISKATYYSSYALIAATTMPIFFANYIDNILFLHRMMDNMSFEHYVKMPGKKVQIFNEREMDELAKKTDEYYMQSSSFEIIEIPKWRIVPTNRDNQNNQELYRITTAYNMAYIPKQTAEENNKIELQEQEEERLQSKNEKNMESTNVDNRNEKEEPKKRRQVEESNKKITSIEGKPKMKPEDKASNEGSSNSAQMTKNRKRKRNRNKNKNKNSHYRDRQKTILETLEMKQKCKVQYDDLEKEESIGNKIDENPPNDSSKMKQEVKEKKDDQRIDADNDPLDDMIEDFECLENRPNSIPKIATRNKLSKYSLPQYQSLNEYLQEFNTIINAKMCTLFALYPLYSDDYSVENIETNLKKLIDYFKKKKQWFFQLINGQMYNSIELCVLQKLIQEENIQVNYIFVAEGSLYMVNNNSKYTWVVMKNHIEMFTGDNLLYLPIDKRQLYEYIKRFPFFEQKTIVYDPNIIFGSTHLYKLV